MRFYRDYKNFDEVTFQEDLRAKFWTLQPENYADFEKRFLQTLNFHAPMKQKIIRANSNAFMTKTLQKAIMK